jgi:hypothetical protein
MDHLLRTMSQQAGCHAVGSEELANGLGVDHRLVTTFHRICGQGSINPDPWPSART